jgi:voltage-gated potassium channel
VIAHRLYQTFKGPAAALAVVLTVGTFGYKLIAGGHASWLDCFYMTFITIATIGFGEVIDLSQSQTGRAFTIVVATFGIGVYSYALSKTTAFLIEGEFNLALRRRRMLKRIEKLERHYIVCGIGRIGTNVARELAVTGRRTGARRSRRSSRSAGDYRSLTSTPSCNRRIRCACAASARSWVTST